MVNLVMIAQTITTEVPVTKNTTVPDNILTVGSGEKEVARLSMCSSYRTSNLLVSL